MSMSAPTLPVKLAVHGGPKVRQDPWPARGLLGTEEKAAVDRLFDQAIASGNAFGYNGPEEEAYCREFAAYMGGGYVDAVNSGTTALYVALKALDLPAFSEVIVGAVTDPGGMMPIPLLNCIPMVADSMPGAYNTGPEQVEALITPLTSAIVVAHIAGEPADMDGILAVARRHGIPVIEDCAQAHGATLDGRLVGTLGQVSAFSTMFGKHHCSGGQGGLVFTRDESLGAAIRRASDRGKPFGLPAGATNCVASLNFNLNDLSAAVGRVQLTKLPEIVRRRQAVAAGMISGLRDLATVAVAPAIPGACPSYWFMRIEYRAENATCDKATFCQALAADGLSVGLSYRAALPHLQEWFTGRRVFGHSGYPWTSPDYKGDPNRSFPCPNALAVMERQFNFYVHENWSERDVADAVEILRRVDAYYRRG